MSHLISSILCHHILDLLQVLVAPATLVEAQSPIGGHGRTTDHLLVLLNHIIRIRTNEEIEVQNS